MNDQDDTEAPLSTPDEDAKKARERRKQLLAQAKDYANQTFAGADEKEAHDDFMERCRSATSTHPAVFRIWTFDALLATVYERWWREVRNFNHQLKQCVHAAERASVGIQHMSDYFETQLKRSTGAIKPTQVVGTLSTYKPLPGEQPKREGRW